MVGALHPSWSGLTLNQSSDRASESARLRCEMRRHPHALAHASRDSRRHLFRVHTIRGIHANRTDTRHYRTQTDNSPRNDSPSLHLEIFIFNRNRRHSPRRTNGARSQVTLRRLEPDHPGWSLALELRIGFLRREKIRIRVCANPAIVSQQLSTLV